jgi:hypothetical protein
VDFTAIFTLEEIVCTAAFRFFVEDEMTSHLIACRAKNCIFKKYFVLFKELGIIFFDETVIFRSLVHGHPYLCAIPLTLEVIGCA